MSFFRLCDGGLELFVWVAPRASRPGLGPLHGERLRAAVSAPPVDGAANEALRELVAEAFSVARGAVSVTQGATGRNKTIRVSGDGKVLLARLKSLGLATEAPKEPESPANKSLRKR